MTGSMQVQFLKSFKDRKLASLKDRLARWVSLHPMCINFFGEDPCGFGLFADQSFLLEGSSTVHLLVSNGVYRKGELHSEHSNIKNVNKPNCSHIMQNNYLLASCTKTVLQTPLCFFHGFPHAWGHRGLGNSDPPGGCRNSEFLGFLVKPSWELLGFVGNQQGTFGCLYYYCITPRAVRKIYMLYVSFNDETGGTYSFGHVTSTKPDVRRQPVHGYKLSLCRSHGRCNFIIRHALINFMIRLGCKS